MRTTHDDFSDALPRAHARRAVAVALMALVVGLFGCRARHAETPDADPSEPSEAAETASSDGSGAGVADGATPTFDVPPTSWAIADHLPPEDAPAVAWSPTADAVPGLLTSLAGQLDAESTTEANTSCETGDGAACRSAAAAAIDGTPAGIESSLALLQLGCAQRDEASCAWLVAMLDRGAAGGQVPARLGPACTRGVGMACAGLGWAAAGRVDGAPPAPEQAEALLIRACDEGSGLGCALLGVVLDDHRAVPLFEQGCSHGYGPACVALGSARERTADRDGALAAFTAGCAAGDVTACRLEAVVALQATDGVLDDTAHAALETACEGADAVACGLLAERLVARDGPIDGLEAATPWFVTACNLGNGASCHRFGRWLGPDAPAELVDDLRGRACAAGVAVDCEAAP